MKILVGRFENDDDNAELIEQFKYPQGVGLRWSLSEFGTQRIEVTVKANGPYDAYDRYKNHHGQRLAVYDSSLYNVVSGNITGINWLEGDRIQYIAKGPYNRLQDKIDTTTYDPTDTISATITSILSNYVDIDDGSTGGIESNATLLNGWSTDIPQGSYPYDEIRELLDMSDSSFSLYDFWIVDQPLKAGQLRKFVPHYEKRSESASVDWVVSRKAIKELTIGRDIDDFATTKNVYYGTISGTATGGSATSLVDSNKNFLALGILPGARVTNFTKGTRCSVANVTTNTLSLDGTYFTRGRATGGSTTTLINTEVNFGDLGVVAGDIVINDTDDSTGTVVSISTTTNTNDTITHSTMTNSKKNDDGEQYRIAHPFASSDAYSIKMLQSPKLESASTDTTPYWTRETSEFLSSMDTEQALQYATQSVDTTPQQRQSFIITSEFIKDGNGAKWPLFATIAKGGGYIQISDLFPSASMFSESMNTLTTFRITSLDYDGITNSLRVGVDTLDTRIDVRLRRANILGSELVYRG